MLGAHQTPRFEDWGLRAVPGLVGGELLGLQDLRTGSMLLSQDR